VTVHLIKLCVGCDTVEELLAWREASKKPGEPWRLHTRQTPKRAAELVDGGSLYRVYKGSILSRQRILEVDTVGAGARVHCEMTLDPNLVLTVPTPRRAFQGWRYLRVEDAPADLHLVGMREDVPADLARRLLEIGAW
jgi:hypothetical protein